VKLKRIAIVPCVLALSLSVVPIANATLIPNPDGLRVYDTFLKVTWLADADLPATKVHPAGQPFYALLGFQTCDKTHLEPCVDTNGAMSYDTAQAWVQALNNYPGDGYLGHHKWTIPRVLASDPNCTIRNWAYNCTDSALGSLYYRSLPSGDGTFGFTYPDTVVPIPRNDVGPFRNFQPYLYWTSSTGSGTGTNSGESTFSFNTGWQGSNHKFHYMYALPMIHHRVDRDGIYYIPVGPNDLQVSSDGEMVWDPDAVDPNTGAVGVTWLADADLAKSHKFGLENCTSHNRLCINPDGSMKYTTAQTWISNMNQIKNGPHQPRGWLEQSDWEFPAADPKAGCDLPALHCTGGPLGELFFKQLGHGQGDPVVSTPAINVGPFYNLQPYLYWSCMGPDPCQGPQPPHGDQEWSFSFGNGYQGTDIVKNNLYVMVYYPQTAAEALHEGIKDELADFPQVHRVFSEADQISSATTFISMVVALDLFDADVNAQLGTNLSLAQVTYLTALAQAAGDATGLQPPLPPPPPPCKPRCI
jgi:hypothetical protein